MEASTVETTVRREKLTHVQFFVVVTIRQDFTCRVVDVYIPAQVSAVELKLEQLAADAERHARRSSFSQSIQESKKRAEREAMPVAVNAYNGGRRRSRMKRRGRYVVGCFTVHDNKQQYQ